MVMMEPGLSSPLWGTRHARAVFHSQPREPEKGQQAGLLGVWSRRRQVFPAKGPWASGAPAKPAMRSHVRGKPCAESGLSADAHEGLGWPSPGRVRLPLLQRAHA